MEIPLKLRLPLILKDIKRFSIVRFQDNNFSEPKPHWYVLIPVSKESAFLVAIITSQCDKQAAYYKRTQKTKAVDCLVRINNNDFSFLNRNSVIDCNKTELLSLNEIIHRADETIGFKVESESVPEYLRKEIVSSIVKSPLTPPFMHKMAKAANPV